MKLLCEQGFYGLLLMHMHFHLSEDNATAWTDGKENIFFHPQFLDAVMDSELEYVMVHLLLHVILDHFSRREGRDAELYYEAADIVVNSNILRSYGDDEYNICLNPCGGVQPHQLPDGEEGYQYTAEEVYGALREEQEAADRTAQELFKALEAGDEVAIRELFSPYARENAADLDGKIRELIAYYPGANGGYTGNSVSTESKRGNQFLHVLDITLTVTNDGQEYQIDICLQMRNDFEPSKEGVHLIEIIREEEKPEGFKWKEKEDAPGVYVAE